MRRLPLALLTLAALVVAAGEGPKPPPLARPPFDADRARAVQKEAARAAGREVELTNSLGMKLVLIPAGRFDMGPNGSRHRVTLSKPYCLAATEVTLEQYRKFRPGHKVDGGDDEFNAADRPAAALSWTDARAFCAWLSARPDEKAAGRVYSLPTEA